MQVTKIKLINFGRHALLEHDMAAPVVGVLGANGRGKSTLLEAIKYALTGDLRDTASTYMKDGGKHGTAVVELDFLKNGQKGRIVRKITKTTTSRSLTWAGEEITAARKVDETMRELLGTDKRAVTGCVFIPQGKLDDILFGDPSEREIRFLRMVGCAHFDTISKAAAAKAAALRADVFDTEPMKQSLLEQEERAAANVRALENKLAQIPNIGVDAETDCRSRLEVLRELQWAHKHLQSLAVPDSLDVQAGYQRDLQSKEAAIQDLTAKITANQTQLAEAQAVASVRAQHSQAAQALAQLQTSVPETGESVEALREQYSETQAALNKVKAQAETGHEYLVKASLHAELSGNLTLQEGPLQAMQIELQAKIQERDAAVLQRAQNKVSLDLLNAALQHEHSTNTCPLCHQQIADKNMLERMLLESQAKEQTLADSVRRLDSIIDAKKVELQAASAAVVRIRESLVKTKAWLDDRTVVDANTVNSLDAETQRLQSLLTDLTRRGTEAKTKQDRLEAWRKEFADAQTRLNMLTGQLSAAKVDTSNGSVQELQVSLSAQQAELKSLEQRRQQLWEYFSNVRAAKEAYDKAENMVKVAEAKLPHACHDVFAEEQAALSRLNTITAQRAAWAQAQAETQAAHAVLQDVIKRRDELNQTEMSMASKRRVIDDLMTLSAAFGRQGMSRRYLEDLFARIISIVGHHLQSLDANFEVRPAEGMMNFEFRRNDEESEWMPQAKLSGGQRVKMAVAFLLALQQEVIPDVGLLVLDEPTTHLDTESQEGVRDLLLSLGEVLKRKECQVIVCDHCPVLEPALSKRVVL